jgi:transcriptional regulator with XRE-family HTH domain
MALFFDQAWFDAQLARVGGTRADVARLLGLEREQIDEMWKDQRELSARDVALLGIFLNVEPRMIAERAGVSTPVPDSLPSTDLAIIELKARVDQLEMEMRLILQELERMRRSETR